MTAAVDQRAVLRIQLQSLVEQLNHVDRALADEHVDVQLRERVAVRFQALVRQRRAAALALRDRLDAGASLDTAWDELEAIRADSLPVFSESLALLEGALARTICLDWGSARSLTRFSERCRASASAWDRFTILADGEYFGDIWPRIFRIRFPDVSVWSLPIAIHESGTMWRGRSLTARSHALGSVSAGRGAGLARLASSPRALRGGASLRPMSRVPPTRARACVSL